MVKVVIRDQSSHALTFRVKNNIRFGKIFSNYSTKKGVDMGVIKFLFDGGRVTDDQSPHDLDLKDGDVIDAVIEQTGGS